MTFADQGASSAVGDLPGYGEEAYFHEDAAYAESSYRAPASHAAYSGLRQAPSQYPQYAPVGAEELQPTYQQAGHLLEILGCSSGGGRKIGSRGCDSGSCDGGCDGGCSNKQRKICGIFDSCDHNTWAQVELLLWFAQDRDMPALVTTSDPGTFPDLPAGGNDNVQVVFGDEIEGELSAGFRSDYGMWVTNNVGLGGRFWILAENNDSYFASGDGTGDSIGRPFFDGANNSQASLLINIDGALSAGSTFGGFVGAESSLDIKAYEAYARTRFSCSKSCRLDFLAGYSHFDIEDSLQISSTSVNLANPATLRTRTYSDSFEAENSFNGGQLGFEMVITRGRWMARSMTKVHLGNMEQNVSIAGVSSDDPDGPGGAGATITPGGLLAQGNQGDYLRDVFAFAPEANFKLGYRFRKNVLLSAGYSFIYWDNVALNGDVVDPFISDPAQLNTGTFGARPEFVFDDSSLWVQGLDLGVIIDF
jgi:hypothetical protein